MKLGEWGRISTVGYVKDNSGKHKAVAPGARKAELWRARANVRDLDGVIRDVERSGTTKAAAERNLLQALRERVDTCAG